MSTLSRDALLSFLDYLSAKGLMNKATASARKAAVNKVLSILDEDEAEDVSKLDIEELMGRFHHLAGTNYTPASLGDYKSRVKSSIDDFLRYQNDPMNFKPAGGGRKQSERQRNSTPARSEPQREQRKPREVEAPPTSVNVLPIPIRPDLTVKIQGLPYDLTAQEANKIANVVKAMAVQD